MKRIYLFTLLSALLMVSPTEGAQINQETALKVAQNHQQRGLRLRSNVSQKLQLVHTATAGMSLMSSDSQQVVYYYVFNINEEDGFIIVSGDDVATPVLGYSPTGKYTIDHQPPAFTYWMECLKGEIEYAIQNQLVPDEKTKAQWEAYLNGTVSIQQAAAVNPLVLTKWNQFDPYNNLCPEKGGEKVVTGCVATAMAQIMKYHEHPARGTGSREGYNTGTGITIPTVSFEVDYQWANMQNTYPAINPVDPGNAVATLMYHCGVSVRMIYDIGANGGSGAMSIMVENALPLYFGYDKSIITKERIYYEDAAWEAILRSEIDQKRPIYYAGSNPQGGHAFVCDGYDDNGMFHFNWGWGGMYDGYFVSNSLNPGTGGAGAGAGTYNLYQSIILNIFPDAGNEPVYEIKLFPGSSLVSGASSIRRGEGFMVRVPIKNCGTTTFSGYLAIATVDDEGNIQEIIGQESSPISLMPVLGNPSGYQLPCVFPSSFSPGNYTIAAIIKPIEKEGDEEKEGAWEILTGQTGYDDTLVIEVKEEILLHQLSLLPDTPLASSSNSVAKGENFTVNFDIYNDHPQRFIGSIAVGIVDDQDKIITRMGTQDVNFSSQVFQSPRSINCAFPAETVPGNYKIRIIAKSNEVDEWSVVWGKNNAADILTVELNQQVIPDQSDLFLFNVASRSGLSISSTTIKQGEPLTIVAGVWNQGSGIFNGNLELGLYKENNELIEVIERKELSLLNGKMSDYTFHTEKLNSAGTYKLRLYSKAITGEKKIVSNYSSFLNDIDITIEAAPSYGLQLISDTPLSSSSESIAIEEGFTVTFALKNTDAEDFSGNVGIGIFKEDNADKEIEILGFAQMMLAGQATQLSGKISCTIPTNFTPGTYQLRVMEKATTATEWMIVEGQQGVKDVLSIEVKEKAVPVESDLVLFNSSSKPGLHLTPIGPDDLKEGEAITVEAGIRNQGTGPFSGDLELGLYSSTGDLVQLIEKRSFSLNNGADATSNFHNDELTVTGTYKLRLYSQETNGEKKLVGNYLTFENDIDITIGSASSIYDLQNGELSISPNPVKNELIISGKGSLIEYIKIYNLTGELQYITPVNQKNDKIVVSLSDLIPGIYILSLETLQDKYRMKIIKE